jgi:hypothetical protein
MPNRFICTFIRALFGSSASPDSLNSNAKEKAFWPLRAIEPVPSRWTVLALVRLAIPFVVSWDAVGSGDHATSSRATRTDAVRKTNTRRRI